MFKFEVELLLSIVFELSERQTTEPFQKDKEKKKERKVGAYRSAVTGAKGGKKRKKKKQQQQHQEESTCDLHWSSDWLIEFDLFQFH